MMREAPEHGGMLSTKVVALQACIKGHLVRKKFQRLKKEYENIVKEIEGSLDWLQWNQGPLSKPLFLPKHPQKSIKADELTGKEPQTKKNELDEKEETVCQPERPSVIDSDAKLSLSSRLSAGVEPETTGVQLNQEHLADKPCGDDFGLPGESEGDKDASKASSVWSSTILEMESSRQNQASTEPHSQTAQKVLRTTPELQQYRKHLAMELLWLQQAIVSRKSYLMLKQRLGSSK